MITNTTGFNYSTHYSNQLFAIQFKNSSSLYSKSICTEVKQIVSFKLSNLADIKPYIAIANCVFEHIITTIDLTNCERLYYLLADSLALISKSKKGHRSCALSSEEWAKRLGCSRSLVFAMQQSLVKKGYFIIEKTWDAIGRNKRNLIIPSIPIAMFNSLNEKSPDRIGEHLPYDPLVECKRSYLDRTKLFIKLNYDLLKIITSNKSLNSKQKSMWFCFYARSYKNYMIQNRDAYSISKRKCNNGSDFTFISSYLELADLYSCDIKYLSKSIRALEELGFIKVQHFYIREKQSDNKDGCNKTIDNNSYLIQERQDQSLWKITLSLPGDCILELEKVKNRSNLEQANSTDISTDSTVGSVENCLTLGGVKFNLSLEQVSLLKSIIAHEDAESSSIDCNDNAGVVTTLADLGSGQSYIESVMEEIDASNTESKEGGIEDSKTKEFAVPKTDLLAVSSKNLADSVSLGTFDNVGKKSDKIKSDPPFAKSGLLLNKALITKIKKLKSNLWSSSKVLFNDFLKRYEKYEAKEKGGIKKQEREFSIYSELIRKKLKELPRDKAEKARKYAYSLVSKKLAKGYAADLNKHELAKQLIYHAASWKPSKLGFISRENEIDTALSVAWKKIVGGTWKVPLELAKAEILQHEFNSYKRKYQESGVLSHDIGTLELDVNKLLDGWCDLKSKITQTGNIEQEEYNIAEVPVISYANNKSDEGLVDQDYLQIDYPEIEQQAKYNIDLSNISEEQKHLKMTPDSQGVTLGTTCGKEYFLKLKELETNDKGELVMTLKPINKDVFLRMYI